MIESAFWAGRKVFLTGHTGFKGTWLGFWLTRMGAEVTGFALDPPTEPSLFRLSGLAGRLRDVRGDIRELPSVVAAMSEAGPEIVFHMAAQPLVRESYGDPTGTFATNVMGTVHVLEAVRHTQSVRAVINVTTDKTYEDREWVWGYRETDRLGGRDPYSASKACSELVTGAYRKSFFSAGSGRSAPLAATARAGNVVGGGDWAADRLIPDIIRAFQAGRPVEVRNPHAVRPWQHVLDPLSGYLLLARKLMGPDGEKFAESWNFGPDGRDARSVEWIARRMTQLWGDDAGWVLSEEVHPPETSSLRLDISKAVSRLGWTPSMPLAAALETITAFHKAAESDAPQQMAITLDNFLGAISGDSG